ncbi:MULTISPECIES: restriction endonuclease subunit S [unclassified Acinetobacter]|uniref:restriction endonuclease subunit S n=1 Tax=unclassified Acinetobacter TaxID=196816 RepID=UPI0015D18BB5|nr:MULTISPECIES: restriction endonuclease subunit S [unclassified Acinetobacter]
MNEWQVGRLDSFFTLKRGYDLPKQSRVSGSVPIIASSGFTDFHNEAKVNESGVVTGRYGTIGSVFFSEVPFWPLNTALYVNDFKSNDKKFIYYFLQTLDWEKFSDKSAVPGVNRNDVHQEEICFPPLPEQKSIASVLSSLDDKIDLLHRQNNTLEAMAETLFRQWFIEEAKEDWAQGKVEDLFILQRGYDLPSSKRVKGEFPLYAASGLNDTINAYQVEYPTVITGRSGSIGGVYISLEKSWPLNTTLFIKEFKLGTLVFSYFYLKYLDLESFNSGSAVPSLNRNHVHGLEIQLPPVQLVQEYEEIAQDWMLKVKANKYQIQTLENLRDTFLPKLMSGEVRIQYQTEDVA